MNKSEVINLIDKHYPIPVKKEWSPSEYDMKYIFNTPRKLKRMSSVKEKEDKKLNDIFVKEMSKRQDVLDIVDEINSYPSDISSLFFSTFKWTLDDLVKRHEAHMKIREDIKEKFGEASANCLKMLRYKMSKTSYSTSWSGRRIKSTTTYVILDDETWNYCCNEFYVRTEHDGEYGRDYPLKSIKDPAGFMNLAIACFKAEDNDSIFSMKDDAYVSAITHMADTLKNILKSIKDVFEGNTPTQCLTDPHWGVDGHFNGILSDGNTCASFKSFGAGGWNIVRFHYRFKVTKLKNK